jgi:hypothetical protein
LVLLSAQKCPSVNSSLIIFPLEKKMEENLIVKSEAEKTGNAPL